MIAVVDYGMGNLGSITNMLRKLGAESVLTSNPDIVGRAERIILPGVGAFDRGMAAIEDRGLTDVLTQRALVNGVPVLGICLGLQLMARRSEEGRRPGLGWLDAEVVRFRLNGDSDLKVPHMGWNEVAATKPSAMLPDGEPRFYFVHSYHLACDDDADVLGTTWHGYNFPSVVCRANIVGVQFHPEKSHRYGLALLGWFATSMTGAGS